MKKENNNCGGQMLIEALIGLALLALSISFGVILVFGGQDIIVDRINSLDAGIVAKEGVETAKAIIKSNWSGTSDGNHGIVFSNGSWQLSGESDQSNIYTRVVSVETIDANQKEITVTITWPDEKNRSLQYDLTTLVTNWQEVSAIGGDTGGGGLFGDWSNPRTLGTVDLGPGNSATDLDVKDKIVHISAEASASSKPDFFIVDATNGSGPVIKSSLDVGTKGLNALDAAGNYVYAANKNVTDQLVVIDVSNINAPSVVASFSLPGVSGTGAVGQSIFYYSNRVYIATKKASGPELHIIDVSNPGNPIALGSKEINADVNGIYVAGDIAYIANSENEELNIFDVSDPSSIILLGKYDAPGDSEDGKVVQLAGEKLYLGRLVGGSHADHHELHIIDVSSSTSPQNLGSQDLAVDFNDLRVRDHLAFLGTSDPNKEFQVWNISNPASPSFVSSFNFPQVATGIDYEDNLVYVAVRSNDALRIITSQ